MAHFLLVRLARARLLSFTSRARQLAQDIHAHLERSFFLKRLKVLINDRDREQDTSTRTNRTEEVGHDRQRADAHTAERRGDGDVPVELLFNLDVAMTFDDHLLLLELLGNISGGRTRDFDPSLREQRASGEHEGDVEDGVQRICRDVSQRRRRRNVIYQTTSGDELTIAFALVPATKELDEKVTTVSLV